MADLILDKGADETEMRKYYGESLRKSALVEGAYETENFWPEYKRSDFSSKARASVNRF